MLNNVQWWQPSWISNQHKNQKPKKTKTEKETKKKTPKHFIDIDDNPRKILIVSEKQIFKLCPHVGFLIHIKHKLCKATL